MPPHLVDTELNAVCICQRYVLMAQKHDLNCFVFDKNSTFSIKVGHRISSIMRIECANSQAGVQLFACKGADLIFVALETGELRLLNLFVDTGKFEEN